MKDRTSKVLNDTEDEALMAPKRFGIKIFFLDMSFFFSPPFFVGSIGLVSFPEFVSTKFIALELLIGEAKKKIISI